MFVVMQQGATEEQIDAVINLMVEVGFDVHRSTEIGRASCRERG